MQSISHIRTLLDQYGLHPKKRFGQNFLHDHNQLRKLIDAAHVQAGDVVLEVGPGTGTLTETLLDAGAQVIAVEIDRDLAALLQETLGERITLIEADCLDKGRTLNPAIVREIGERPFKMVANLPYNAASPLMTALLLDHPTCTRQCVTIQKEVADRLTASPSTKAYGPLGIIVQALARVEKIGTVPASCFWPQPQVVSAMVAITPIDFTSLEHTGHPLTGVTAATEHPLAESANRHAFARFITDLFSKRRKQLGSIIADHAHLPAGVVPRQRPETLSVEQLIALWQRTGVIKP